MGMTLEEINWLVEAYKVEKSKGISVDEYIGSLQIEGGEDLHLIRRALGVFQDSGIGLKKISELVEEITNSYMNLPESEHVDIALFAKNIILENINTVEYVGVTYEGKYVFREDAPQNTAIQHRKLSPIVKDDIERIISSVYPSISKAFKIKAFEADLQQAVKNVVAKMRELAKNTEKRLDAKEIDDILATAVKELDILLRDKASKRGVVQKVVNVLDGIIRSLYKVLSYIPGKLVEGVTYDVLKIKADFAYAIATHQQKLFKVCKKLEKFEDLSEVNKEILIGDLVQLTQQLQNIELYKVFEQLSPKFVAKLLEIIKHKINFERINSEKISVEKIGLLRRIQLTLESVHKINLEQKFAEIQIADEKEDSMKKIQELFDIGSENGIGKLKIILLSQNEELQNLFEELSNKNNKLQLESQNLQNIKLNLQERKKLLEMESPLVDDEMEIKNLKSQHQRALSELQNSNKKLRKEINVLQRSITAINNGEKYTQTGYPLKSIEEKLENLYKTLGEKKDLISKNDSKYSSEKTKLLELETKQKVVKDSFQEKYGKWQEEENQWEERNNKYITDVEKVTKKLQEAEKRLERNNVTIINIEEFLDSLLIAKPEVKIAKSLAAEKELEREFKELQLKQESKLQKEQEENLRKTELLIKNIKMNTKNNHRKRGKSWGYNKALSNIGKKHSSMLSENRPISEKEKQLGLKLEKKQNGTEKKVQNRILKLLESKLYTKENKHIKM